MRRALMAAGFFLALAPGAGGGATTDCWPPPMAEAVAVRVLQSELVVGALVCDLPDPYAAFVAKQEATLQHYGEVLTDHFVQTFGSEDGQRRLDALVTRLANEASGRKINWSAGYCDFMRAVIRHAAETPSAGLGRFARSQPHARRLLATAACGHSAAD